MYKFPAEAETSPLLSLRRRDQSLVNGRTNQPRTDKHKKLLIPF
jgi:hypothetical protein